MSRGFLWLCLEKGARLGLTVAVTGWVVRYLGAHDFGLLQVSLSFVSMMGIFLLPGIDTVVVRRLTQQPQEAQALLRVILKYKTMGVLVSGALLLIACKLGIVPKEAQKLVALLALSGLAALGGVVDLWFQSDLRFSLSSICKQFGLLVGYLARVTLIVAKAPLIAFASVMWIEAAATSWMQVRGFKKYFKNTHSNQPIFFKSVWKEGWPLVIISGLVLFYSKIDVVMLSQWSDPASTGIYASAQRLLEIVNGVPTLIATLILPVSARLFHPDKDTQFKEDVLEKFFGTIGILSILMTAGVFIFAPQMVKIIFGRDFLSVVPLFRVLCLSVPLTLFSIVRFSWLISSGLQRDALVFEIWVSVLLFGLLFWVIPQWGTTGAAWCWVSAIALANAICCLTLKSFRYTLGIYLRSFKRLLPN